MLKDAQESLGAPTVSTRECIHPYNYKESVKKFINRDPLSYHEAPQHQLWKDVMVEEYNSIVINDVWEVMPKLVDKLVFDSHWIYKING